MTDKPDLTTIQNAIPTFKYWVQTALPAVYDDSLSYYELLAKVIQALNDMGVQVTTLTDFWNNVVTWVEGDGVDTSVRTRLDKMVIDGTLSNLINGVLLTDINNQLALKANKSDLSAPTDAQLDTWFNAHPDKVVNVVKGSITPSDTNFIDTNIVYTKASVQYTATGIAWESKVETITSGFAVGDSLTLSVASASGMTDGFYVTVEFMDAGGNAIGNISSRLGSMVNTLVVPNNTVSLRLTYWLSRATPNVAGTICKWTNVFLTKGLSATYTLKNNIYLGVSLMNLPKQKPLVTWIDDDTNSLVDIAKVKTICDALGIKATFGCVTNKLDLITGLKDTLLTYQQQGFHITSHSHTHDKFWYAWDATYNITKCEDDLVSSLKKLRENGFLDYDYFVAPGGSHSPDQMNLLQKWGRCLVNAEANTVYNHLYQNGRYNINRVFLDATLHDLNYYKAAIDTALANGDWLVFGTHSYDVNAFDSVMIQAVLQYVKDKGIEVATLNHAMKKRSQVYNVYEMFTI